MLNWERAGAILSLFIPAVWQEHARSSSLFPQIFWDDCGHVLLASLAAISLNGVFGDTNRNLAPFDVTAQSVEEEIDRLYERARSSSKEADYVHAIQLMDQCLEKAEKAFGANDPKVAMILNELGLIFLEQKDLDGALPLLERSLVIREKHVGPHHRDVAATVNNLASLYQQRGDYQRALPLFERSLAIWEEVLGKDHPDVATSLN